MNKKKVSNFLTLCSLLLILGFIIKIIVKSLVHKMDLETLLFGALDFIFPAIILMSVNFYIRKRSKNSEEKR